MLPLLITACFQKRTCTMHNKGGRSWPSLYKLQSDWGVVSSVIGRCASVCFADCSACLWSFQIPRKEKSEKHGGGGGYLVTVTRTNTYYIRIVRHYYIEDVALCFFSCFLCPPVRYSVIHSLACCVLCGPFAVSEQYTHEVEIDAPSSAANGLHARQTKRCVLPKTLKKKNSIQRMHEEASVVVVVILSRRII